MRRFSAGGATGDQEPQQLERADSGMPELSMKEAVAALSGIVDQDSPTGEVFSLVPQKGKGPRRGSASFHGVLQPYSGDIFGTRGTYLKGRIYRSRLKAKQLAEQQAQAARVRRNCKHAMLLGSTPHEPLLCPMQEAEMLAYDSDAVLNYMGNEHEAPEGTVTGTQRRCAAALRNLSWDNGSEESMVEQGALPALVELSSVKDLTTQQHVAATLRNLSTEPAVRCLRRPGDSLVSPAVTASGVGPNGTQWGHTGSCLSCPHREPRHATGLRGCTVQHAEQRRLRPDDCVRRRAFGRCRFGGLGG